MASWMVSGFVWTARNRIDQTKKSISTSWDRMSGSEAEQCRSILSHLSPLSIPSGSAWSLACAASGSRCYTDSGRDLSFGSTGGCSCCGSSARWWVRQSIGGASRCWSGSALNLFGSVEDLGMWA